MIGTLTPVRFSFTVYGWAKSRVVTMNFSQQGRALKIHYPRPFPFVGELWLQMTGA